MTTPYGGIFSGKLIDSSGNMLIDLNKSNGANYLAKTSLLLPYTNVIRDFNASGSSTTTTGTITSGSSTLTLASAIDFKNGQGIAIAGAGASGALLVTSIVSGAGTTTLTLANSAGTSVSNANVYHDDTVAIQNAINSLATTGGTVYFPTGVYNVNNAGAKASTNNYNTLLPVPYISTGTTEAPITIAFVGDTYPSQEPSEFSTQAPQNVGSVILTSLLPSSGMGSYGAIIGGPSVGLGSTQTSVVVYVQNLTIRQQYTGVVTAIDVSGCVGAVIDGVICDTVEPLNSITSPPSTGAGAGIWLPDSSTNNNYGMSSLTRAFIAGLGIAVTVSEHAVLNSVIIQTCGYGIYVDKGSHAIYGGYINSEWTTYDIALRASSSPVPALYINQLDIEVKQGNQSSVRIADSNNLLKGVVNCTLIQQNIGQMAGMIPVSGAANLKVFNLNDTVFGSVTPPASPLVSGTVYQNTRGSFINIYQPAYATTSGTAGTVAVALGASSTPSTIFTRYINGSTSSSGIEPITLRVPPGWYYSFTTTGATLANAVMFSE